MKNDKQEIDLFQFHESVPNKTVCDNVGAYDLCNGCGAASLHYKDSCEPCPVSGKDTCMEYISVIKLLGIFLTYRGISHDFFSERIKAYTWYSIFRFESSQPMKQPKFIIIPFVNSDSLNVNSLL